jgi:hypothetical protein
LAATRATHFIIDVLAFIGHKGFVVPLHGSVLSPRFDSTHIKDAKNKLRFFFGSWATKEQKHQLQSVTFVLSKIAF